MTDMKLSMDDLSNTEIYVNDRLTAIRCRYCRQWVFISDGECMGCGAHIETLFGFPIVYVDDILEN